MFIEVERVIEAPVEKVWGVLGDFGGSVDKIFTMCRLCDCDGNGLGATRIGWVSALQDIVRELCVQYDPERYTLAYTVVEPSPLATKNYVAVVRLSPVGDNRCRVNWSSHSKPTIPEDQIKGFIERAYEEGIEGLERAANT